MKVSNLVFDGIDGLNYKCDKTGLNWGGSIYILLIAKEAPKNSKNKDDKYFQYAVTILLKD